MENNDNGRISEESSNIPNEERSNFYQDPVSRISMYPGPYNQNSKNNFIIENPEKNINKNNETLPIKRTISTFNFKIVLIGNVSVGKSSIIKRFINNEFNNTYICTVGTELSKKSLLIEENKLINLFIWDTCGQERFRTVTRQYYRDTEAILLVFDLTNEKSFNDLYSWLEEAINYINISKCLFFLIGNKVDETDKICVKNERIKNFVRKNQRIKKYFEVSAFNGHNINLTFDIIGEYLVKKFSGEEINKNMKEYKNKLKLENEKIEKNKDKKCC